MVDTRAVVPVLVDVKDGISPMPLPARPMAVLELVHEYVAPVVVLEKSVPGMVFIGHTVMSPGTATMGEGLTVMMYVEATPVHELAVGVTLMVAVIGLLPVSVAVKSAILPVPLAVRPMAGFELVQA